jgi:hypothetical protein
VPNTYRTRSTNTLVGWKAEMNVKFPIINGRRVCTGPCHEDKPIEDFYRKSNPGDGPSGWMSECKDCFKARMKAGRVRERRPLSAKGMLSQAFAGDA